MPIEILVLLRIVPTMLLVVPNEAAPPTCQKTLYGETPPLRRTWEPELTVRSPATWKMKTSSESPSRVMLVGIKTEVPQVYTPALSVRPPMEPAPRLREEDRLVVFAATAAYAAVISPIDLPK